MGHLCTVVKNVYLFQFWAILRGTPPASCDLDKYHLVKNHVEAVPDTVKFVADLATDPVGNAEKAKRDLFDFASAPDKSKLPQHNYTWAEVAQFDGVDGRHLCIVYDRKVLDVTDFYDFHPGGPRVIQQYLGRDATVAMRASGMSADVLGLVHFFQIGLISDSEPAGTYEEAE